MIGLLQKVVIHRPIPTVVKDWILNYNTKHRSKKNAPLYFRDLGYLGIADSMEW